MAVYTTASQAETQRLARKIASALRGGDVLAYRGGLGAGKTAFTRGLGEGLGVTDHVASPTFAIASVYRGGRLLLVHFDMYRVRSAEALEQTGYYQYLAENPGTVYAIEWSENIQEALPDDAITVTFETTGETGRKIVIEGGGGRF